MIRSEIFNLLGIVGVTAMIAPAPGAHRFAVFDAPVMIAASVAPAVLSPIRPAIGRGAGVALLAACAAYPVSAR